MATFPFDQQANEYSFAPIDMELSELNFSLEPTTTTLPSTITAAISDYQAVVSYDVPCSVMRKLFKISSNYTNDFQEGISSYNDASHVKLLLGNADASANVKNLDTISKFFGFPESLNVTATDLSNTIFNTDKSQPISSEYIAYLAQVILNDSTKASVFRNTNLVTMDLDSKMHMHMNATGNSTNAPSINLFNSVYSGPTAHELLYFKDLVLYAMDASATDVDGNTVGADIAIELAIAKVNELKSNIPIVAANNSIFNYSKSLNTSNNSITDISSVLYYNQQDLSAAMIFISGKLYTDISGAITRDGANNNDASYNTALHVRQAVADLFYTEALCMTYAHQIYTDRANTLNTIYKTVVNKVASYQDVFLAKQAALAILVDVSNNYTTYSNKFTNSYLDINSPHHTSDASNVIMKTLYQDISGLNLTISSGGYNSQKVGNLTDTSRNGLVNIIASMTNDLFSGHLQSLYNAVGLANPNSVEYANNLRSWLQQYKGDHRTDASCVTGFYELQNVPSTINIEFAQALQANNGGPTSYISDQFLVKVPTHTTATPVIVSSLATSGISGGKYGTYSGIAVEKVHYGSSYINSTKSKYFRNIPWFIYKNMYAQAPQRFNGLFDNPSPSDTGLPHDYYEWQTFSMPFQVGDTIEYAIQVTPNPQQMHIGEAPKNRKYLMQLKLN